MATLAPLPVWQEFDDNGKPLNGAKLYCFEAGTDTPKDTYTDSSGSVENSNPVVFNAAGRASIWLSSGSYKLVLKDKNDNIVWTKDNVKGIDKLSSVDSIDELRRLQPGQSNIVYVSGYYSAGGGGGGWFRWDNTSTTADDDGVVIAPSSSSSRGRWLRFIENNQVNPRWFGAVGNGIGDDTSYFLNADNFAVTNGYDLIVDAGDYKFETNPDLQSKIVYKPNAKFIAVNSTITIDPIIDPNDNSQHFEYTGTGKFIFANSSTVNATWFGSGRTHTEVKTACDAVVANNGIVRLTKGVFAFGAIVDLHGVLIDPMPGCKMIISTGCAPVNVNIYGNPQHQIIDCALADTPTLTQPANFKWFGAVLNGTADDSSSVLKTVASSKQIDMLDNQVAGLTQLVTLSGHKISGANMYRSGFKKIGNLATMFHVDDTWGTSFDNVCVLGNGVADFTGGTFLVDGNETSFTKCYIDGSMDTPILFPADKGASFLADNCIIKPYLDTVYIAALVSGNDASGNPRARRFVNCSTGGKLFVDFSGMVTTFASNCFASAFRCDINTAKMMISNSRFTTGGSPVDITVIGHDNTVCGCSFAMASGSHVYLNANATQWASNVLIINSAVASPIDNFAQGSSVVNVNRFDIPLQVYTSNLTTTETETTLGNSTIVAYMSKIAHNCKLNITFTTGSTVSWGTGAIALDAPYRATINAIGTGFFISNNIVRTFVAVLYGSNNKIYLYREGVTGPVEVGDLPFTTGSIIQLQLEYIM